MNRNFLAAALFAVVSGPAALAQGTTSSQVTTDQQRTSLAVAQGFVDAWNARAMLKFERPLHPEFQGYVAATEPGVEKMRTLKSNPL